MLIINHKVFEDQRGVFEKDLGNEITLPLGFVMKEHFYTHSFKGVIRAIHFQEIKEQAKIIRCIKGRIWDVIVDLRKDSDSCGSWEAIELHEGDGRSIYVPRGFGHGYLVLEDAIVSYRCDECFFPEGDSAIQWNDADLNISWPEDLVDNLILSDKDMNAQSFRDYLG